jgi:hypothetical protein
MSKRPRIDLDGVTLAPPDAPESVVAIFRYRTVEGPVVCVPESADMLVPWQEVEAADLDLATGRLSLRFTETFVRSSNWLRGARTLVGTWTDRIKLRFGDLG